MKRILFVLALAATALFFMGAGCEKQAMGTENAPAASVLKTAGEQTVVIETAKGTIKFKFFKKDAPGTCDNFIKLTEKGFYNGLTFHRYEPGFVIQGGDPNGNGSGGPGYNIKAEFNKQQHITGAVAMARAQDPNSAGSQFYICLAPAHFLDNNYTVFGQVTEGMETVLKLRAGDVMKKVFIETK